MIARVDQRYENAGAIQVVQDPGVVAPESRQSSGDPAFFEPSIGQARRSRLVGQKRIDVHGNFGHANAVTLNEIVECRWSAWPDHQAGAIRHEPFDELQHAVGLIDKTRNTSGHLLNGAVATFIEQSLALTLLLRRQIEEGREITGRHLPPNLRSAFGIDQRRRDIPERCLGG